ncbi:hypothetical protein [Pseudobacteriovorax antillogorgiicola]|uniref:hypothetical protein n=1 Tax=Pseudobacteriovorax antillogorgiicola TaxID=1513793 RepID=UPI00135652DE|nr:hypothetical protein [Pseudobacteriovorax antillogorgiicola]
MGYSGFWALLLPLLAFAHQSHGKEQLRGIFLNGIDISSAKHQTLENVTIRIDGQGNIYIEAPHYEVNEESTYIPLSSWNREGMGLPDHKPRGPLPESTRTVGDSQALPRLSKQASPLSATTDAPAQDSGQQAGNNDKREPQNPVPTSQKPSPAASPAGSKPQGPNPGSQ